MVAFWLMVVVAVDVVCCWLGAFGCPLLMTGMLLMIVVVVTGTSA